MDADEFQKGCLRTSEGINLICGALGLTGESGEFADMVKKIEYQGHPFNDTVRYKMLLELGDILYYVAATAYALDADLSYVMEMNKEKLKRRYPNGFTTEDSIERRDLPEEIGEENGQYDE